MAYLDRWPSTIMFWCQVPPGSGGQTPMVDMAAIYRVLDPDVRARFEERGIMLIQNVPGKRTMLAPR